MEQSSRPEFTPKEGSLADWLNSRAERLEIEDEMQELVPERAIELLNTVNRHEPEAGLYFNPNAEYRCIERRYSDNWLISIVQGDDGERPYNITVSFSRTEGPSRDIDINEALAVIDPRPHSERPLPFRPRVTARNGERLPVDDLAYIYTLLEELKPEDS